MSSSYLFSMVQKRKYGVLSLLFLLLSVCAGAFSAQADDRYVQGGALSYLPEGSLVVMFYQDSHGKDYIREKYVYFEKLKSNNNVAQFQVAYIDVESCGDGCWTQSFSREYKGLPKAVVSQSQLDILLNVERLTANSTHRSRIYHSQSKSRLRNVLNFDPSAQLSYRVYLVQNCKFSNKLLELYNVHGQLGKTTKGAAAEIAYDTQRMYKASLPTAATAYNQAIQSVVQSVKAYMNVNLPMRNEASYRF